MQANCEKIAAPTDHCIGYMSVAALCMQAVSRLNVSDTIRIRRSLIMLQCTYNTLDCQTKLLELISINQSQLPEWQS